MSALEITWLGFWEHFFKCWQLQELVTLEFKAERSGALGAVFFFCELSSFLKHQKSF